jgi:uncharacterized SAM-binding protein YcdF (DUF218 family)
MTKRNKVFRFFRLLFWIGISWFLLHAIFITIDGLNDSEGSGDVAIVLGNRVFEDGTLASWTQSGGLGVEDHYPEGKAMKEYLVRNGVPDSAVIADNGGANTYLTAKDFLDWDKKKEFDTVIIVSQFYHITRSKYILRKLGYKGQINSASSEVYNWQDAIGTAREVPAFYKYWLVY